MNKSKKMYLFGAGGHAKVIWDATRSTEMSLSGCFSDSNDQSFHESLIYLGKLTDEFDNGDNYLHIAIGNNRVRKEKSKQFKCSYYNVKHLNSSVSNLASIGIGNSFLSQSVVNPFSKIMNHCIINTGSIIEHDCELSDYVHVSPNATLCGNVKVGEGTHIGAGAVILPNIKIGKWVTIGAGAVVLKDVPDYAILVGNPGQIIKYNTDKNEE